VRKRGQEFVLAAIDLRQVGGQLPQVVVEPLALGLRLLALADIPGDLRCADDVARIVLDRRDRERNLDAPPVFATPLGLEVVDPLSRLEARDDLLFLGDAIWRDDERDVAADSLLRGIAEQPLGAVVPGSDGSVERLAHDRVVGGRDDRREQARSS
jgi:hypothetical protein